MPSTVGRNRFRHPCRRCAGENHGGPHWPQGAGAVGQFGLPESKKGAEIGSLTLESTTGVPRIAREGLCQMCTVAVTYTDKFHDYPQSYRAVSPGHMNGRAEKQGRTGEPKIGPLETGTWRPEYQYAPEYRFRGPINMIKSRAKLHLDFRAGLKLSARDAAAERVGLLSNCRINSIRANLVEFDSIELLKNSNSNSI
jgi:hypothetical protein